MGAWHLWGDRQSLLQSMKNENDNDNKLTLAAYQGLLARVRETLILGQRRIEALKAGTYWDTGFYINEHLRRNEARAEYGKQVFLKLSRDTGFHVRVYERCARFAEKFPNFKIPAGRPELPGTPRQIEKVAPNVYKVPILRGTGFRKFNRIPVPQRTGTGNGGEKISRGRLRWPD